MTEPPVPPEPSSALTTSLRGRRIFITGGAGFIGSHLVERLVEHNTLVVYDNFDRNALRFSDVRSHPNLTVIEGDVLDAARLHEAMKGADLCIHSAAIAGIYTVGQSVTRTLNVNLLGTMNALEAAAGNGVARVVEFSTSEVYGPFVYRGKETDHVSMGPPGEKRWVYAASKLAGEFYSNAFARDRGLRVVTVRPFNIYGPRQVGEGAIQQMVHRALAGEDLVVYNDGTQVRSWCFISDFVDATLRALVSDLPGHVTFNIGNPQATITVFGLAEAILRHTGSRSRIVHKPHPGPEVEMRVPDVGAASAQLGFTPRVGLEEGLRRTIDWYRTHLAEGA
jgi:UDP-glucose 4-epimerase